MENQSDSDNTIYVTSHWRVGHRRDARFPGYLMVSSMNEHADLFALPSDALAELGPTLARTERILRRAYSPIRVIFYKLGFSAGFSCHFHVAPVTRELLDEVTRHPLYDNEPDGNDVILFLSRVYCERKLSMNEQMLQRKAVEELRAIERTIRHDDISPAR